MVPPLPQTNKRFVCVVYVHVCMWLLIVWMPLLCVLFDHLGSAGKEDYAKNLLSASNQEYVL